MSEKTTLCQTCGDVEVIEFLSLGQQPACEFPADAAEAAQQQTWPVDLGFCPRCSLVQLLEPVSDRILFSGDYHHVAGLVGGFRRHLQELAFDLATFYESRFGPDLPKPRVVELGSNDGSLLDDLAERGFQVLGVDPNGVETEAGSTVVQEYFTSEVAEKVLADHGAADVVVANNTFAHVTDLHDIIDGIRLMMKEDGVFVSESHYLGEMLEGLQYDFAYHEHSRYYSLTALNALFARHGLEIFRVDRIATHGGSIRVWAGYPGAHEVEDSVAELRAYEVKLRLTDEATYRDFAVRVQEHKEKLRALVREVKSDGSRVVGASCPARAVTILNYCELGPDDLEFVSDISPRKIGRLSPGTHIPMVHQERLGGPDQPEYVILFGWYIADEVIERLRVEGFKGKFIFPLPEPRVITDW